MAVKTTETVETPTETPGVFHIPGVHNMQNTLCGFVDVINQSHDYRDHPVNCRACIDALKAIQALRFPGGYFDAAPGK